MGKKVIINADDLGMSEGFNEGAIKALRDGVASSTTIMINQPAAEHAISLLKEVPGVYVGLHVNLTTGSPVSNPEKIPSLVKPNGEYIGSKDFKTNKKKFVYEDCYTEIKAQVKKFKYLLGYYPSHIEMHSAMDDQSNKAIMDVAKEFGLHYDVYYKGEFLQPSPEKYFQVEEKLNSKVAEIINRGATPNDFFNDSYDILKDKDNGLVTALHFHPGYVDAYILDHSTLTLPRVRDLQTLTSKSLKGWIEDNDIDLISYGDLKK